MHARIIIIATLLFSVKLSADAQNAASSASSHSEQPVVDKRTTLMQNMIVKLAMEAATDFKKIKGNELSRKEDGPVFYQAMISYLAKDDDERGAMLTADDKILAVHGNTYYMAMYTDDDAMFSLRGFAEKAFLTMTAWQGDARFVFTTKPEPVQRPDELKSSALFLNGKRVALFNDYLKAEKSAIIIGLEK